MHAQGQEPGLKRTLPSLQLRQPLWQPLWRKLVSDSSQSPHAEGTERAWVCLVIIRLKLHCPHQSIPPGMRHYLDVFIVGHLPACPVRFLLGKLVTPVPTFHLAAEHSSAGIPPPNLAASGFCVPLPSSSPRVSHIFRWMGLAGGAVAGLPFCTLSIPVHCCRECHQLRPKMQFRLGHAPNQNGPLTRHAQNNPKSSALNTSAP